MFLGAVTQLLVEILESLVRGDSDIFKGVRDLLLGAVVRARKSFLAATQRLFEVFALVSQRLLELKIGSFQGLLVIRGSLTTRDLKLLGATLIADLELLKVESHRPCEVLSLLGKSDPAVLFLTIHRSVVVFQGVLQRALAILLGLTERTPEVLLLTLQCKVSLVLTLSPIRVRLVSGQRSGGTNPLLDGFVEVSSVGSRAREVINESLKLLRLTGISQPHLLNGIVREAELTGLVQVGKLLLKLTLLVSVVLQQTLSRPGALHTDTAVDIHDGLSRLLSHSLKRVVVVSFLTKTRPVVVSKLTVAGDVPFTLTAKEGALVIALLPLTADLVLLLVTETTTLVVLVSQLAGPVEVLFLVLAGAVVALHLASTGGVPIFLLPTHRPFVRLLGTTNGHIEAFARVGVVPRHVFLLVLVITLKITSLLPDTLNEVGDPVVRLLQGSLVGLHVLQRGFSRRLVEESLSHAVVLVGVLRRRDHGGLSSIKTLACLPLIELPQSLGTKSGSIRILICGSCDELSSVPTSTGAGIGTSNQEVSHLLASLIGTYNIIRKTGSGTDTLCERVVSVSQKATKRGVPKTLVTKDRRQSVTVGEDTTLRHTRVVSILVASKRARTKIAVLILLHLADEALKLPDELIFSNIAMSLDPRRSA